MYDEYLEELVQNGEDFSGQLGVSRGTASSRLRSSLGLRRGAAPQAHHIIPWQLRDHPVVVAASRRGFNINGLINGLPMRCHRGSHDTYSRMVKERLDEILEEFPDISDDDAARELIRYIDEDMRPFLQEVENSGERLSNAEIDDDEMELCFLPFTDIQRRGRFWMELTDAQKDEIFRVLHDEWEDDSAYEAAFDDFLDSVATPAQLFFFAYHFNWDYGEQDMFKIIRHPMCDRATALMIYWLGGAEWFLQYHSVEEVPDYERKEGFRLVMEIETKYLDGSFAESHLSYDPTPEVGRYSDLSDSFVRSIPDVMKVPVSPR